MRHTSAGRLDAALALIPLSPLDTGVDEAVNELLEHDDPARHAYYGLVARLDDAIDTAGGSLTS